MFSGGWEHLFDAWRIDFVESLSLIYTIVKKKMIYIE